MAAMTRPSLAGRPASRRNRPAMCGAGARRRATSAKWRRGVLVAKACNEASCIVMASTPYGGVSRRYSSLMLAVLSTRGAGPEAFMEMASRMASSAAAMLTAKRRRPAAPIGHRRRGEHGRRPYHRRRRMALGMASSYTCGRVVVIVRIMLAAWRSSECRR